MTFLQLLRGGVRKISLRNRFSPPPPATQREFLERLPSPGDDWERSYLQYRCQKFLQNGFWAFAENCAAAFLLPVYWFSLRERNAPPFQPCGAALLSEDRTNVVPRSLWEEYNIVQIKDFQTHARLDREDRAYLRSLRRRYPFAFYFRFKCMVKVAMYSSVLARCRPKAIICEGEESFTSSLLTDYCRRHHIKHINIQHGIKSFFIRDSFFHFDRSYVWDQGLVDIFVLLHAEPEQFIVERPPSLSLAGKTTKLERVDYTYYLQAPTPEGLKRIMNSLAVLQARGAKVAVRPHPLHMDAIKSLYRDTNGVLFEDPHDIPIEQSLLRTGCVISLGSTVLFQAAWNAIPIVVDDIVEPEFYKTLKESQLFAAISQKYRKLSELLHDGEPDPE